MRKIAKFANIFQAIWDRVIAMNKLTRHLKSVDESYVQHGRHALGFAVHMFVGSLACLLHALCPFLFQRTGSDIIRGLHDRMVVNRRRLTAESKAHQDLAAVSTATDR